MSTTAVVIIILVIVVVAALTAALAVARRHRRLRQRFGPEYDRLVGEQQSRRKAEAELTQRERRVRGLHLQPLSEPARARYAQQWETLQEQFVDTPADAVAASQTLITAVLKERGYPIDDHDQVLADLSVDHARTLERYREAEQISDTAAAGGASTEDMRQAMIQYRELFRELLSGQVEPSNGWSAASGQVPQDTAAGASTAEDGEASDRLAERPDPIADDGEQPGIPSNRTPRR